MTFRVRKVRSLFWPRWWRNLILWWRLRHLRADMKRPRTDLERQIDEKLERAFLFGEDA